MTASRKPGRDGAAALRAGLGMAALSILAACAAPPPGGGSADAEPRTAFDTTETERRARVRLELASAYFARGQTETALDELKQALAIKPDLAEAYNLRGLVYASLGNARLVEESFQRALQLNPQDGSTLHNLGWYQCQQRRYAEADATFGRALALPQYREVPRTLLAQGVCQARSGQLPEAERTLMRAYEIDPSSPVVAVNLAEVLYRRGEYARAKFYVGRVNAQPEQSNAQTLWLAARVERKLGDRDAVEDYGLKLRNRYPQAPETLAFERGRFDD